MPRLGRRIRRMRESPSNIRFDELAGVLGHLGFKMRRPGSGGSHVSFWHPDLSYPITVKWQPVVNRVYVRQALDAIDELGRMSEDDE
jgi:predicted RNA binding protein YcfA (HicA-like mRNA interferase family)